MDTTENIALTPEIETTKVCEESPHQFLSVKLQIMTTFWNF